MAAIYTLQNLCKLYKKMLLDFYFRNKFKMFVKIHSIKMPNLSFCHKIMLTNFIKKTLKYISAIAIDCQRPPQLIDPSLCCKDGGRDEITENCAKRMGITGQPSDPAPTVETATCLAECIITESKYMQKPEQLEFDNIRNDLYTKFNNDTIYAEAMLKSFQRCQPNAVRKMQAFRQMPLGNAAVQRGCSPYASILLGCTYMEYFKNCPAHRWTENADCALAKQFVVQCALGA
ncbi:uncharacterized protein LOC119686211 [Teleopsis dalmanni]|uniref:uncharacterized protein LOC119680443 n=1 Tax=Teleopsis dalmanni TaxID=139649 RepID=UPI0018CFDA2D|nr:uncharacterized protein LOC119680443 [Teleopsis dalmanni]XP_037956650.1 uncharacterized protein LOC119686211 [Teleopsis dalmanni]